MITAPVYLTPIRTVDKGRKGCYTYPMKEDSKPRAFKTKWFARAASKANITDSELCEAFKEIGLGQCDDLGGGVYKKRLNKNMHRSIVVAKGGRYWVYAYLFAKKDRENIDSKELKAFKDLADLYENKTVEDIDRELAGKELVEICNDKEI